MRGVPRERCAILPAAARIDGHTENARGTRDDLLELGRGVELQALHDAEAIAQWRGQQTRARGRAYQGERLQGQLDGTRGGTFADHDVELEIFHGRIQHFFDHRREAMDLVDEQHIARLQVGQQRREIAGPFEHRTGGLAQIHAELARQDVRERGLAQSRRSENERVIQRFTALDRGLHENLHLRLDLLLPDIVGEPFWPDGAIDGLLFLRGRSLHDAIGCHSFGRSHRTAPCKARRIRSSVLPPEPAKGFSICVTSAGL